MTCIRTEEASCSPNGITFHSKCPSGDRKLVFHSRLRGCGPGARLVVASGKVELREPLRSAVRESPLWVASGGAGAGLSAVWNPMSSEVSLTACPSIRRNSPWLIRS